MYFRFGGKDVHMPKLIGAFILMAAFLMFVRSSAVMFGSWDQIKTVEKCISDSWPNDFAQFNDCRERFYRNTGVYLATGQAKLANTETAAVIIGPIAELLFWAAILFVGYMLYRTGDLILPVEERWRDYAELTRGRKRRR